MLKAGRERDGSIWQDVLRRRAVRSVAWELTGKLTPHDPTVDRKRKALRELEPTGFLPRSGESTSLSQCGSGTMPDKKKPRRNGASLDNTDRTGGTPVLSCYFNEEGLARFRYGVGDN